MTTTPASTTAPANQARYCLPVTTNDLAPRFKLGEWLWIDPEMTPALDDEILDEHGRIVDFDGSQVARGVVIARAARTHFDVDAVEAQA